MGAPWVRSPLRVLESTFFRSPPPFTMPRADGARAFRMDPIFITTVFHGPLDYSQSFSLAPPTPPAASLARTPHLCNSSTVTTPPTPAAPPPCLLRSCLTALCRRQAHPSLLGCACRSMALTPRLLAALWTSWYTQTPPAQCPPLSQHSTCLGATMGDKGALRGGLTGIMSIRTHFRWTVRSLFHQVFLLLRSRPTPPLFRFAATCPPTPIAPPLRCSYRRQ